MGLVNIKSWVLLACLSSLQYVMSERFQYDSIDRVLDRQLLTSGSDEGDDIFDGGNEEAVVYQTVSSTTGGIDFSNATQGWSVTYINATLELDTAATYATNFNVDSPGTWAPGTTRFNVSLTLENTGSVTTGTLPSPTISVRLHTKPCNTMDWSKSWLANNSSGDATTEPAAALSLNISSSGTTSGMVNMTNSTIYDFLVDYDEAKSVVIYGNNNILACQNLIPPFPDFPSDWSATIETTDVERGFTYVFQEIYSQTLNKIRLDVHSFGTDRIIVTDASSGSTTIITPSNGSCQARNFGRGLNWITQEDNTTLLTTAQMLHFLPQNNITYVPGFVSVRGIPCEVWQTSVEFSTPRFNMSFDVEFYFPVNAWLVGREDYHRMLKRVYMNGTRNGEPFEMYDEYVNFRPRTVFPSLFEVCAISPYGKHCNCTDALRRQAFSNVEQALSGDEDISVGSAAADACAISHPIPHGFVRAQSGPYVGLTIIGMVGGSLITGVAMYLIYSKRTGVRITDNLSHQKFQDAPGT